MPLSAGSCLGPYEIVAPLGAGGMGEVYKARDTRLGRDVAIKVLPAVVAADPDARGRFEREARTISRLNHPHICVLYDIGQESVSDAVDSSPVLFLVMEYLEGESLAARIARGPIPPDEALEYAMQIADALDKAHRHGVVHRDLKPANVMLIKATAARTSVTTTLPPPSIAKLLDFGVAKLAPPPSAGTLATVTAGPATAAGTILGTFEYMSPEQVEAHDVDARADIWAFGCVLYEMLTGRRAFEGRSQASLIAAVLERDPPSVTELQPLTPPALARVVRTCLAKDPNARFQNAFDLLLQLQWIREGGSAVGLPAPVIAHRKRRERSLWIAATIGMLGLGAAGAWLLKPEPVVTNVSERFSFPLAEGQVFTRVGRRYVSISPDGRRMAYIADKQIYLREMDQLAARPIPGTQEDPLDLVFSPDGQWIAYFVPGTLPHYTLKKIPILGGAPVPLCASTAPFGVSWQGGAILFGQNETVHGIQSVPDTAGTPTTLVTVGNGEQAAQPQLLDDGKRVLFSVRPASAGTWDDAQVVVQAPGDAARVVLATGTDGRVIAGHRLVYYRNGAVVAVTLNAGASAAVGSPVPIVQGVQATGATGGGAGVFAVAANGTLLFVPGVGFTRDSEPRELVWVDRKGQEEVIPAPQREYMHPRLSPEGDRIVVVIHEGRSASLFTWELSRQVLSQVTPSGDREDNAPVWSDSRTILYRSRAPNGTASIMRVDANGAGAPERLLDLGMVQGSGGYPQSVSPDGKLLIFRRTEGTNDDLMALPLDGADRTPRPLLAGPANETHGRISPDGKWLLYALAEPGGDAQMFVRPYPDVGTDRRQVSSRPGSDPIWARSSHEVFFLDNSHHLVGASVEPGPVFGRATEILDNRPYMSVAYVGTNYDVSPDGSRFLMIRRLAKPADPGPRAITVVTHWIDELKARAK